MPPHEWGIPRQRLMSQEALWKYSPLSRLSDAPRSACQDYPCVLCNKSCWRNAICKSKNSFPAPFCPSTSSGRTVFLPNVLSEVEGQAQGERNLNQLLANMKGPNPTVLNHAKHRRTSFHCPSPSLYGGKRHFLWILSRS